MGKLHAYLSASSSHRWLNCPASPNFEKQFEQITSEYAQEGTIAHKLAELKLKNGLGVIDTKTLKREAKKLDKDIDLGEKALEIHKATDTYFYFIANKVKELNVKLNNIYIEQEVNFDNYVPKGYGTCDCLLLTPEEICVIDFKYGQGVKVDAENNSQLRLYALGAYQTFKDYFDKNELLYDLQRVTYAIIQPRMDNISSYTESFEDLLAFGEEIKPIAQKAYKGCDEFHAGEWCQFCRGKYECRARAQTMEIAQPYIEEIDTKNFDPARLSDVDIAKAILIIPTIKSFVEDVEKYALEQALNGKKYPGLKLAYGRGTRKYQVEDKEIIEVLSQVGYEKEDITKTSVLGVTELEKLMGKNTFKEILEKKGLVKKENGKLKLVSLDDKREEVNIEEDVRQKFLNN